MSEVAARLAAPEDLAALSALAWEMQRHYDRRFDRDRDWVEGRLGRALFGPQPQALAFLAEAAGAPLGLALVNHHFPTDAFASGLFIKEIFVRDGWRGRGAGRRLLAAVIAHARALGHSRVDWTTEAANTDARRLYGRLGAKEVAKTYYRVGEEDFTAFLNEAESGRRLVP